MLPYLVFSSRCWITYSCIVTYFPSDMSSTKNMKPVIIGYKLKAIHVDLDTRLANGSSIKAWDIWILPWIIKKAKKIIFTWTNIVITVWKSSEMSLFGKTSLLIHASVHYHNKLSWRNSFVLRSSITNNSAVSNTWYWLVKTSENGY